MSLWVIKVFYRYIAFTTNMKILFIHPNFPGQFKHLIERLRLHPNYDVAFLTRKTNVNVSGVNVRVFKKPARGKRDVHRYLRRANEDICEAQEISRQAIYLRQNGFVPEVVIGHTGWAGVTFIKEIFPETKIIGYCEWYFQWQNSWSHFSGQLMSADEKAAERMQNVSALMALDVIDVGVTPMHWQKSVYPMAYQPALHVIHEGIDTDICIPKDRHPLRMPGIPYLSSDAVIVSYISRSLEPARGFPQFMAAAEKLLASYANLQIIVVGRERAAYSKSTGQGDSYKKQVMENFHGDLSRVHFTGKLNYQDYLSVLQNSAARVYLTLPLFLSWSMLEAMSVKCPLVVSNTPPVTEVIEHEKNGLVADFFDVDDIASQVSRILDNPELGKALGDSARETILERYQVSNCVEQWCELIDDVIAE